MHLSKTYLCSPQVPYTSARPTTMPTKPTKPAQPNKFILSIMPTLLALPAMPADLACYAYITNKKQPWNYSFVAGLKSH